jgi:hypothetical protein
MTSRSLFTALAAVFLLLARADARRLTQQTECPEALADAERDADGELILWGTQLDYATGNVGAYTKFASSDCSGGPSAVGVEISTAALENLPGPDEVSMQPPPDCLEEPRPGCPLPYDSLWLNFTNSDLGDFSPIATLGFDWNPSGHSPPGLYDAPHIDFHFYLVPQAEIETLVAGPCAGMAPDVFELANEPFPASCFPGDNYTNLGAVAPYMGNHFLSTSAPEVAAAFSGGNGLAAWNHTWIWGGYNGEITYFEPMVKRSFLLNPEDMCYPIPGMPENFALGGWRPSEYCVTVVEGGVRVELRSFQWYESGCADPDVLAPASYYMAPPGSPPLPADCEAPAAM